MKIGNGKLRVGILGVCNKNEKELSIKSLEELAEATLRFYPLDKIFSIPYINSIEGTHFPNLYIIKENEGLDIISVIKRWIKPTYDPIRNTIYSIFNPEIFAHELGHVAGLEHVSKGCGQKKCSELKYARVCPHSRYIMGCAGTLEKRTGIFSQEELKKLEGYF